MDGRRFDSLTRDSLDSRRTLLAAMLAGGLALFALDGDVSGKKKHKKKRKKQNRCGRGRSLGAKGATCVEGVCQAGESLCANLPGDPNPCCRADAPHCGPYVDADGRHACCPDGSSQVCPPDSELPVGRCCRDGYQCCAPSHNGVRLCCDPTSTCCRGRDSNPRGACCNSKCCENDGQCPENQFCSSDGCCEPSCNNGIACGNKCCDITAQCILPDLGGACCPATHTKCEGTLTTGCCDNSTQQCCASGMCCGKNSTCIPGQTACNL